VTPHHPFPATVSPQRERRLRLLTFARPLHLVIIEDHQDHELHFDAERLLLPALRAGYVAAPVALIDAVAHGVSAIDGRGNT
jgi:GntR family transcriptional regulator / MocR family aminotransferase